MKRLIIIIVLLFILTAVPVGLYFFPDMLFPFALFSYSEFEAGRFQSPNGLYDAVLVEYDAGAMTVARYLIYIKRAGEKTNKNDYIVFGAKKLFGENIHWKNDNTLRIEYESARIFSFRNYWFLQIDDKYHEINIEEICTKNQ